MTFVDVLSRISQIDQQLDQLSGATTAGSAASSTGTTTSSAATGSGTSFADALAQAQDTGTETGTESDDLDSLAGAQGVDPGLTLPSSVSGLAVGSASGGFGLSSTGSVALPAAASGVLTSGQQQFASRLAADTGLNPSVISAWLLAEESGPAAQSRQAASNNDWLNIGYTDSGTYGGADSVWSSPAAAADATAGWLQGKDTIPGYGTASAGVQAIVATVGQTPSAQISAIQDSGWASSGYPDLPSLYAQVTA